MTEDPARQCEADDERGREQSAARWTRDPDPDGLAPCARDEQAEAERGREQYALGELHADRKHLRHGEQEDQEDRETAELDPAPSALRRRPKRLAHPGCERP